MKLYRQLTCLYLACCLGLAGAAGISPSFHRLIEHGGRGAPHTHFGVSSSAVESSPSTDPGSGAFPWHSSSFLLSEVHQFNRLVVPEDGLDQRSSPRSLRPKQDLHNFLEADPAGKPTPSDQAPRHHHDSLPQRIASGLLDLHLDYPLLCHPRGLLARRSSPSDVPAVVRDWDIQTAPRGPPG